MDPFSGGASILAVLETAATVALLVAKYVSAVKAVEKNRQQLLHELYCITVMLSNFSAMTDPSANNSSPTSRCGPALEAILGDKGPLAQCQQTLEELLEWLKHDDPDTKLSLGRRMLWPIKHEKKITEALQKLERYKAHFTVALSTDSYQKIAEVHETASSIATEQERTRLDREVKLQEDLLREIITWLDPRDYITKHQSIARLRQRDTCTWLFDHGEFKSWRSSKSAFLWLHGIPGSGKSTLASSVIDELQANNSDDTPLIYFYCDFRDAKSTTSAALIHTLLAQFLRAGWSEDIHSLAQIKARSPSPPTDIPALRTLLLKAIGAYTSPFIVIDALDECQDILEILPLLSRLHDESNVRLFMTSRKEHGIYEAFKALPSISLKHEAQHVHDDIKMHVQSALQSRPKLARLPADVRSSIETTLLTKANGMFRWVQCQLDFLNSCRTRKGVQDALHNLPKGLFETYERILATIEKQGPEVAQIARSSLVWLVGALSPLTLQQVNEAIMIEKGRYTLNEELGVFDVSDILDICGSLVEHLDDTDIIILSHFTVKEFLSGMLMQPSLDFFATQPASVTKELAQLTLTYLLLEDFSTGICHTPEAYDARLLNRPLLEYAATHWYLHVADMDEEDEEVLLYIKDLFMNSERSNHYSSFRQVHQFQKRDSQFLVWNDAVAENTGPLWFPLYYNSPWVVSNVLHEHPELLEAELPLWGATPLITVAYRGHTAVGKLLLDMGADIEKTTTRFVMDDHTTVTPLSAAVGLGHVEFVEMLLKRGACVNTRSAPTNETPLHAAAHRGRIASVSMLLERGADVHAQTVNGWTALHTAAMGGNVEVVELLLASGCEISGETSLERSPLQIALDLRSTKLVEVLLKHGAAKQATLQLDAAQLDWAQSQPWYSSIAQAIRLESSEKSNCDFLDVWKVRHILHSRFRLSPKVVDVILDDAEYWACTEVVHQYLPPKRVTRESPQEAFVRVRVKGRGYPTVRKLVFVTRSHDQGFSGEREAHGTYRWSWTWFETGVSRRDDNGVMIEIVPRQHIQFNVHASSITRTHVNVWEYHNNSPEMKAWLGRIVHDDEILVIPRAEFPAWCNWVEAISVKVYTAA
ncbi:unnamed protein product [Somion occarium]|uniref:NACHT domain-containing protein n=1 Tax=Somion occarium TaxID=3059160 RepID=A0ABP1D8M5_9APHY